LNFQYCFGHESKARVATKGSKVYFGKRNIMYVINKQLIANAFGVYQNRYFEDPKEQVTKTFAQELLFKHDIKPPYTNVD